VLTKKVKEWVDEENVVLRAARRNCQLAYRPRLELGRLERADAEAWAAELPEGSHRIHSSWVADRYKWLDPAGKPVQPDWSRCAAAAELADLQEVQYCDEQEAALKFASLPKVTLQTHHVDLQFEEQDIIDEESALLQVHPRARKLQEVLADPLIADQRAKKKHKLVKKKKLKLQARFSSEFLLKVRNRLQVNTRRELLEMQTVKLGKLKKKLSKAKSKKKNSALVAWFSVLSDV
jgi:hypothetical protein